MEKKYISALAKGFFLLLLLGNVQTMLAQIDSLKNKAKQEVDPIILNDVELDEVTIVHQAPVVKLKTDKVTYQMDNDAESKTHSVLEMLRKVPMVTVDGRNNITVNGAAQFKVYVDGRLNNTITRNPSKMLRNMPASNIKRIEVLTNPGAQYDAEGAGGVLCIYTKKGEAKKVLTMSEEEPVAATAGSVHAMAGLRSWGGDVSLSHQQERWSWDMNLNGEYWYSPNSSAETEMLVENALKHNEHTLKHPLQIRIFTQGRRILVENNKQPLAHEQKSTHLGNQNLEERYLLLSREKICIENTPHTYSVSLPIL